MRGPLSAHRRNPRESSRRLWQVVAILLGLYIISKIRSWLARSDSVEKAEETKNEELGSTGGNNHPAFVMAQGCLRNSPFAPNPLPLVLKDSTFVPKTDLKSHYREMLTLTEGLRDVPMSSYAGYSGPWIENFWVKTFCCDHPLEAFGGMVPLFVLWTDLIHARTENWFKSDVGKQFINALRKDVIYVTVSQHDDGISPPRRTGVFQPDTTWNILVLSSGGVGHIPLPLILQPLNVIIPEQHPKYLFGFAGRFHHFTDVRDKMRNAIEQEASKQNDFEYKMYGGGPDWVNVMKDSIFNMAPRGYGRTSFRLTEIIQMGLLPVHIWDDDEWIPYKNSEADLREFGFSVQIDNFASWVRRMAYFYKHEPKSLNLEERKERLMRVRDAFYSYEGVMQQIKYFLQASPLNALSCQRHPIPVAWNAKE